MSLLPTNAHLIKQIQATINDSIKELNNAQKMSYISVVKSISNCKSICKTNENVLLDLNSLYESGYFNLFFVINLKILI